MQIENVSENDLLYTTNTYSYYSYGYCYCYVVK